MAVTGYIVVTVAFRRVGRRWTAYCEELGTATFGRSLPEAERRIKEAVVLHLNTLEDVGERERFFKKYNIQFHHTKPRKEVKIRAPLNKDIFLQSYVQPIRELTAV